MTADTIFRWKQYNFVIFAYFFRLIFLYVFMAITGAYLIYGFCKVGLQFKIAQLIHEKDARRNANMKKIDLQNKFIF